VAFIIDHFFLWPAKPREPDTTVLPGKTQALMLSELGPCCITTTPSASRAWGKKLTGRDRLRPYRRSDYSPTDTEVWGGGIWIVSKFRSDNSLKKSPVSSSFERLLRFIHSMIFNPPPRFALSLQKLCFPEFECNLRFFPLTAKACHDEMFIFPYPPTFPLKADILSKFPFPGFQWNFCPLLFALICASVHLCSTHRAPESPLIFCAGIVGVDRRDG